MEKKIVVDQKSLMGLLASMQPICSKRTALETTTSILFHVGHKELVLKSTDLEVSLQASCGLRESTLEEPCSFLVSGKRIFEVVKELDGDISLVIDDHQIAVQAGTVNLALNIKNAQEFPPFPERIENLLPLDAQLVRSLLESVSFLIPQNSANPALNGLLLEVGPDGLTMTATDGHCLAQVSTQRMQLAQSRSWLLPRRAVFELKKILETSQDHTIFVGVCSGQLVFSGELFNFFTKLLADKFPHYQTILQKDGFIPATIDRSRLTKTLRRASCFLSGQFLATKFSFNGDAVQVSMHNKEVGKLDEELAFKGSVDLNFDIRFYAPYLLNGVQAFNQNDIKFFLKSNAQPVIFESETADFRLTYLVMPVSPTL